MGKHSSEEAAIADKPPEPPIDEARFRRVFLQAGIAQVLAAVEDGSIVAANAEFCRLLGYSEDELFARKVRLLTHPDDRPAADALSRRLLAGEAIVGPVRKRYLTKNGRTIHSEIYLSCVKEDSGAPRYAHALVLDRTEEACDLERLRRSDEGLDLLLDGQRDFVCHVDLQGSIRWATSNAAHTLCVEQPVGLRLPELIQDEQAVLLRRALAVVALGEPGDREVRLRVAEDPMFGEWSVRVRPGRDGGAVVAFRDVTDTLRYAAFAEAQAHILRLLSSGASRDEVLNSVATLVERQLPGVICTVLIDDGGRLRHGAAPSMPREFIESVDGALIAAAQGSCGSVMARGVPVIVEDIATDELWASFRDIGLRAGVRSCWSMPVRSRTGEMVAALAFYHRATGGPAPREWELAAWLAPLLAVILTEVHPPSARPSSDPAAERSIARLTPREREVLRLVALGHTNREVADLLFLSLRTVESHRSAINRKLGAQGRVELVRVALGAGLLP